MSETLGQYLRRLRERRRRSLRDLARLAGVSHSTLGMIETGKIRQPKPATLRALSETYGVSLRTLAAMVYEEEEEEET